MRNPFLDRRALIVFGLFMVISAGCASSPPSKFYQLNSIPNGLSVTRDGSPDQSMVIVIGPVLIPDYLDRPQIVTRSGKNDINLSEFNRWAGSLANDINRVLVEDVATLLPANCFFVVRWTPFLETQVPVASTVEVAVERFEGTLGGSVVLRAQWAIFAKDRQLLVKKETEISEKMSGSSYDTLVGAMSSALEKLSRDIADGITLTK